MVLMMKGRMVEVWSLNVFQFRRVKRQMFKMYLFYREVETGMVGGAMVEDFEELSLSELEEKQ